MYVSDEDDEPSSDEEEEAEGSDDDESDGIELEDMEKKCRNKDLG